jgi:outer membrane protein OmpA-like peptidoglycan-associated protein
MQTRALNLMGRILLAGVVVALGTMTLPAQSKANAATTLPDAPASRWDVFAGYSYLSPNSSAKIPQATGSPLVIQYKAINAGALASGAYYFNRYIGVQLEQGIHPSGGNDDFYTTQAGLIARYPTTEIVPFIHALAGGALVDGPHGQNKNWGVALTVGGGLDYNTPFLKGKLGVRLFQADYEYIHEDFGSVGYTSGVTTPEGRASLNATRLSSGLIYHIGSIVPPPPVTLSCSASPASVFPGEPITITGVAGSLNAKKPASYTWTGAKGNGATATVDTAASTPGTYTVTGKVEQGLKVGQSASCSASYTVKAFEPPTISCVADPSTVKPGDSVTITSKGISPQNRPLTYSYSASAGSISGTQTSATLSTAGAPSGSITVSCNVQDDKGQTATSTTSVTVLAPPPPPAPKTAALCSINFERDKKRPARVDNEAKACLDDVALSLQKKTDATTVVVGEAAPSEKKAAELAAQRAVNTKDYLVTEKGIAADRIAVKTGTAGDKKVENYLVPAGATFENDVTGTSKVDETAVKVQARNPVKKHHAKKAVAAK